MNQLTSTKSVKELFFPNNEKQEYPLVPLIDDQDDEQLESDFKTSRETIRSVIESAEETLENLIEVVKETDSPRAFEVANQFLVTISNASKDLLDVHEKYRKLKMKKQMEIPTNLQNTQINNNNNVTVFSGNGRELLELIKGNS